MSRKKVDSSIATIGIDTGKNSFHLIGHDERGATSCDELNAITRQS